MERLGNNAPLPSAMQGRWIDMEDPASELVVRGGDVICFGEVIPYDYKLVVMEDGALTVSLKMEDETKEDAFERANITELVITPEGDFHAYNVKFSMQLERVED